MVPCSTHNLNDRINLYTVVSVNSHLNAFVAVKCSIFIEFVVVLEWNTGIKTQRFSNRANKHWAIRLMNKRGSCILFRFGIMCKQECQRIQSSVSQRTDVIKI